MDFKEEQDREYAIAKYTAQGFDYELAIERSDWARQEVVQLEALAEFIDDSNDCLKQW